MRSAFPSGGSLIPPLRRKDAHLRPPADRRRPGPGLSTGPRSHAEDQGSSGRPSQAPRRHSGPEVVGKRETAATRSGGRFESPDIALLDIAMPGLNGLEVAERIAQDHPETRVLLLSMHANEEYVLQALRAGSRVTS